MVRKSSIPSKQRLEVEYTILMQTLYTKTKKKRQEIRESGVTKEEVFIMTKVWNFDRGCGDDIKRA
ncbi:hypothetical protein [Thermaerobacillus caldiproteolyticus]|uniref:hypothetical protein n=1 Tax=Thermaerobacillus caldiproteolyticus TaxID=247480 RepID=UPI00188B4354|nr:hypothetical protein [Anoxybacillus caldiproteolyticus]QPA31483.1 hypothetical protein ISX45_00165 [Anoxybacillus caldiproteolyticus]